MWAGKTKEKYEIGTIVLFLSILFRTDTYPMSCLREKQPSFSSFPLLPYSRREQKETRILKLTGRSRQPWSTYAVHLTTLSPPALLGDCLLVYLCHKATETLDGDVHWWAMRALGIWMFISKFIKLLGHYRRYPADFLLLPVSILFGYFHGAIKIYAAVTLNVVSYSFSSFLFLVYFTGVSNFKNQ